MKILTYTVEDPYKNIFILSVHCNDGDLSYRLQSRSGAGFALSNMGGKPDWPTWEAPDLANSIDGHAGRPIAYRDHLQNIAVIVQA